MIVVCLNGGLGNQMFQFAAAYALSARLGVECKVDVSILERSIRRYELECFTGAPPVGDISDLPLRLRLRARGIPDVVAGTLDRWFGGSTVFQEQSSFVFDRRFLTVTDGSYLVGYFQTEKYFSNVACDIERLFTFHNPPSIANTKILDQISNGRAVSVHVRRADYVSDRQTNQFHGTCSLEYYAAAFGLIADRVNDARFFVFSDDPLWARQNIKPPGETIYVDHNKADAAYEDMRLMSACQHHIVANSSFSWWAAWLNASPEKVVVAPKRWLADPSVPLDDLLPEKWIAI